jgi:hypothetical protein
MNHQSVSADTLVFEYTERGPDDDLKLQFEVVRQFDPDEKQIVKVSLGALHASASASSPNGSQKLIGSPPANPYRLSPPAKPMGSSCVNLLIAANRYDPSAVICCASFL